MLGYNLKQKILLLRGINIMSLMSQFKYAYLFSFLIIFIGILIIICFKITNYLFNVTKKEKYIWYMEAEQHYNLMIAYPKITILSIIGVIDSIALFAIISKLSF
jgi:hypothetical protein